ncbi:MAG TPA: prepilin-type N-terminal cleavage/methylation domain-containing protein [Candidatus Angelobacter sp.]
MRTRDLNGVKASKGFSLIELLIVVAIILIVAAIAVPTLLNAVSNIRVRSAAGELSGIMQEARILAAKKNTVYDIKYTSIGGIRAAYVDANLNGSYDAGEPVTMFNGVTPASGPPSGSSGQPTAYVLTGDSSTGTPFDNRNTVAFSPRGLPCNYDASTTPATCATPAASYFVYYLQGSRASSWAAVVVTKGGRTQVVVWNGTQWSN